MIRWLLFPLALAVIASAACLGGGEDSPTPAPTATLTLTPRPSATLTPLPSESATALPSLTPSTTPPTATPTPPSATPSPTATPPTGTPSASPSVAPPTASPTVPPPGDLPITILTYSSPVKPTDFMFLVVLTRPGSNCYVTLSYEKAEAGPTRLQAKDVDAQGQVDWTWRAGDGPAQSVAGIAWCRGGGRHGAATFTIQAEAP